MSLRFRDIEKKPQRYPKVVREDPTIDNPGFVEVDGYRLRPNLDLMPQRGMQENLCASECNLIFLGGSGTSGKTFGALLSSMKGLGYQNYTARIVTMQSKDNEVGTSMKRDAEQVFGGFAGCNFTTSGGLTAEWPQWNNSIKFIHVISISRIRMNGSCIRATAKPTLQSSSIGMR